LVDNESIDRICSRIREDGEKEIESILEKAKQTADDIESRAKRTGEEAAGRILKEATDRGGVARKRLLSSVNLEVKRAKLRAREEVVSAIQEKVERSIADIRHSGDYAGVLAGLTSEAIRALGGGSFIVSTIREDLELLEKKVFPAVREQLKREGRAVSKLEAKPLEKISAGGVQVGVPGGNVIYDNTFEARIYRLREDIRNIIFEEVFSSGQSEERGSA
jgi:vacuolar-type H+-ATPase subunit E/Vma4